MESETFIYYENDFIDCAKIFEQLLNIKNSKKFTTNYNSWDDKSLVPDGVGVIKRWQIFDSNIKEYISIRLATVFPQLRSDQYIFNFEITEWNENSFIPWHNDEIYFCAATCYLDSNTSFGGEFMCKPFEDQTMGMFVEPIKNRVILVRGVEHCVTKIHKGTRTTLQMWGAKKDANIYI